METSDEQIAEYSVFNDGLISSIYTWANCVFTHPSIAMVSTCWAIILLFSRPEEFWISTLVVGNVAKVILWITCCKFEIFRSVFLFLAFNWLHISGLTFIPFMSEQFWGCLYLSVKLLIFSEDSFLPHRFRAISASSCWILLPMASSLSRLLAKSWRSFVSLAGVTACFGRWPLNTRWAF